MSEKEKMQRKQKKISSEWKIPKLKADIWSFLTSLGLLLDAWRLLLQTGLSQTPLIKRLGEAFVSKLAAEPLNHSAEFLKPSAGLLSA